MSAEPAPAPAETPKRQPLRDALRLAGKALAVAALCLVVTIGIVVMVPEGNDYAEATLIKHHRLEAINEPKIVLVGGSNLAYGIDTRLMEQHTHTPVVNMGMNGYFGVRYMLEEVRPSLRRGDTVVIALEYDNFFKPVEGTASNLLVIVKANPSAFNYLSWRQRLDVLGAAPYVAQEKIIRILQEAAFGMRDAVFGAGQSQDDSYAFIEQIETRAGFNAEGDLTSHLGVTWPFEHEQGTDPATPVDPHLIPLLSDFNREMEARGVRVMISYTPLMRSFYDGHQAGIDRLHTLITEAGLRAPHPPSDYVYDDSLFFDTVYHLNAEGRALRSERLAEDINAFLGPTTHSALVGYPQTGAPTYD
jgi:hypothetical protein